MRRWVSSRFGSFGGTLDVSFSKQWSFYGASSRVLFLSKRDLGYRIVDSTYASKDCSTRVCSPSFHSPIGRFHHIYANEDRFIPFGEADHFTRICTILYFLGQIVSPLILTYEVCNKYMWISALFMMTAMYTWLLEATPILCHAALGTVGMKKAYSTFRVGGAVYYIGTLTSLVISIDVMVIVLVVMKVFALEQVERFASVLWGMIWPIMAVTATTILVSWWLGLWVVLSFGLCAFLGKRLAPSSVIQTYATNQNNLFIHEKH